MSLSAMTNRSTRTIHRSWWQTLRSVATLLVFTVLANCIALAAGPPRPAKPMDPITLKQALTQRGIGKGVRVKELDGTQVIGILTAIRDDNFDLAIKGTNTTSTITYPQVAAMRNDGMSTGAKVATGVVVGVVVGVAAIAIFLAIALRHW